METWPGNMEASTTNWITVSSSPCVIGSLRDNVNTYQVVGSVNLGVDVNDGASGTVAVKTRVGSQLASSNPMVSSAGASVGIDVISRAHTSSRAKEGDSVLATGSVHDRLDTPDDNFLVRSVVEIRLDGDMHAQAGINSHASPGNHTGAQVLGHGDQGGSSLVERTLSTDSPLELTGDTVSANEGFPRHSVGARGGSGEDTSAVVQVVVSISDVGSVVGGIKVVGLDGRLAEDHISVGVVKNIVSYGKSDPTSGRNHARVGAGLDNVELVSWANTAAEEDLGRPECTGRKDDSSGVGGDIDDTNKSTGAGRHDLDTSNPGTSTDDLGDGGVDGNSEVGTGLGGLKISSQRTATLTIGEHERRAGKGPVLLVGDRVGGDLGPASRLEDGGEDIVGLLEETDTVHGRIVCRRNSREDFVHGSNHVGRLPASREVVVPITIWRPEE